MDLVSLNNVETEYAWITEVSEQLYGAGACKYGRQHNSQRYTSVSRKPGS